MSVNRQRVRYFDDSIEDAVGLRLMWASIQHDSPRSSAVNRCPRGLCCSMVDGLKHGGAVRLLVRAFKTRPVR